MITHTTISFAAFCFFLIAVANPAKGGDASASSVGIKIVKSPVKMREVYSNATNSVSHNSDTAIRQALVFFAKTQNRDGSWGNAEEQELATPLVLLSLLHCGVERDTPLFGNVEEHARNWVLQSSPQDRKARFASISALAVYSDLFYGNSGVPTNNSEISKIRALREGINGEENDIWSDFSASVLLPNDSRLPKTSQSFEKLRGKYQQTESGNRQNTLQWHLSSYLSDYAQLWNGTNACRKFYRSDIQKLIEQQQPDGGYPVSPSENRFAVTALAVLRLSNYWRYDLHPRSNGGIQSKSPD